jgi:hypothetical protein
MTRTTCQRQQPYKGIPKDSSFHAPPGCIFIMPIHPKVQNLNLSFHAPQGCMFVMPIHPKVPNLYPSFHAPQGCMFVMPIHPKVPNLYPSFHAPQGFVCLSCPSIPKAYDLIYGLNKLLYSTLHLFPQDAKCPSTIIECIEIKPLDNHVNILETKDFKGPLERFACP